MPVKSTNWRPPRDPLRTRIPVRLREWLEDPASMTARIERFCGGALTVRVLREYWGRPTKDEAAALGLAGQRYVRLREVLLLCGATPWVYARTVMPPATLRGSGYALVRLGSRPLGSLLFGRAGARRGPITFKRLDRRSLLRRAVQVHVPVARPLWARRSELIYAQRRLLVTEVFLPALMEQLDDA